MSARRSSSKSARQNQRMLLLIDLDNTLIDRRAAFKGWALSRFGESELPWLISADRDGFETREALAARRPHVRPHVTSATDAAGDRAPPIAASSP